MSEAASLGSPGKVCDICAGKVRERFAPSKRPSISSVSNGITGLTNATELTWQLPYRFPSTNRLLAAARPRRGTCPTEAARARVECAAPQHIATGDLGPASSPHACRPVIVGIQPDAQQAMVGCVASVAADPACGVAPIPVAVDPARVGEGNDPVRRWSRGASNAGAAVGTTDQVTSECGKRVVNGVDFLARRFDLRANPVDVDTSIGDLGLGDNDCAMFERYVNKQRKLAGKPNLPSGTVDPSTTIQKLITYAC